ncbi:MAG: ribosome small subunit-dependent GTPase A [Planctomycetales bacterium]|nr:ribosome small subunit-dependent GTPase A [Planctomycetales bacterium]
MSKKRTQKTRVDFRKNRGNRIRQRPLDTRSLDDDSSAADLATDERISGKGGLSRRRTVITVVDNASPGSGGIRDIDASQCLGGLVISPRGAGCIVRGDDGRDYECTVRRVVKTMASSERTAVVAGDRVLFRPASDQQAVIERVEPRRGVLARKNRKQQHVLAANVDQLLIVMSAADPPLKPSLVDRYLISAAQGDIRPIVCINKVDLVDLVDLQPIVGVYSQLGYDVAVTSTLSGYGLPRLRSLLRGRSTAFSGQSGVGKTSLLNSLQPGLGLKTKEVAEESRKGKHTTTHASLLELSFGGWVVDTPGIRQFELWDVIPDEVEGYFVEFRPFVATCKFPDCSHTHEAGCGVKRAVDQRLISAFRYESYLRIRSGDPE